MTLNVGFAMNRCVRFIAVSGSRLRDQVSILLTSNLRHTVLSRTYINELDCSGTLSARSHQGFNSRLKGVARELAVVIGLSLSIASMPSSQASVVPLKVLANKQLTDKQYECHNQIVYKESRWNERARNGSHHGYYQGKSIHLKDAPYDYQFYWYWYYVANRYGVTQYDEPNYCAALNHLNRKGFQ